MAPRKLTVVAALVRGLPVSEAIDTLKWTQRAAAISVRKLILSAVANATDRSKGAVDIDNLYVRSIWVDQGPTQRRHLPRAMGRATRINKKTSHVHVVVADSVESPAKN